jgi:hypothetical protein
MYLLHAILSLSSSSVKVTHNRKIFKPFMCNIYTMKRQITINVEQEIFSQIENASKLEDRSKSSFIRQSALKEARKVLNQSSEVSQTA